jgi:hypothetical protein
MIFQYYLEIFDFNKYLVTLYTVFCIYKIWCLKLLSPCGAYEQHLKSRVFVPLEVINIAAQECTIYKSSSAIPALLINYNIYFCP